MARKRPARVREPIQVYLAREDRALLDSVAKVSGLSRAEVLRRGIRAVSGELMGDEHPALKFMQEMHALMADDDRPLQPPMSDDEYHERIEEELLEAYLDRHESDRR